MPNRPNVPAQSVMIALDGESKCGKTTIIDYIADGAQTAGPGFNGVIKISAGNIYRAAAMYKMGLDSAGIAKDRFEPDDAVPLQAILERPGIYDVLQHDKLIGRRVSTVAKMAGIQALCETLFVSTVVSAHHRNGGGNLVVVDGRNPVECLDRHQVIGRQDGQIRPDSIMPVYIDTPADIAAARMEGDFDENLAIVIKRRTDDATRPELPAIRPAVMLDDLDAWACQFGPETAGGEGLAVPYRLDNGRASLEDLEQFGLVAAKTALAVARNL